MAPRRAGAPRAAAPARGGGLLDPETLIERAGRGEFPATLYVEGPDEALKAALLAELRAAWAAACPDAPAARVFRAAESGVDEILAAFHGSSLFTPRELSIVLEIEDLGRSERKLAALAEGITRPGGASTLLLVESAADSPRKSLEPLRRACAARWIALPPTRELLARWGSRRLARSGVQAGPGIIEAVMDACEGDPGAFFNELDKLSTWAGPNRALTREDVALLLRPVLGADLPEFLAAVALGDAPLAAQRLSRLLAAGAGEGTVLFALANLAGGAMGGWARYRDLSMLLRGRASPRALARAFDAIYRCEAAWKRGHLDAVVALEQATRAVCAAGEVAAHRARR